MNFEKIEMAGFKSFADKVEIIFNNGVTAIVGPNGCGKSNIADAIRWVLGEQSAKSLRGSAMSDVIFSGTQNRKSLSYCEVSLYFDNSEKIFKSVDYSEVILTRKLFRSGESEYYINKQPSLLREIVKLLHECGVSKSGYSVIGQGKVQQIVESKPEDRRSIFEEAVGIAQAKVKKLETERKLERVHGNLVRIFDMTSLMEKKLEPLHNAAEKTKKYRMLSEELKYHEVNNYLYQYDNANSVKEKIFTRIEGLKEESALRSQELDEAIHRANFSREEIQKIDQVIDRLHGEILSKSLSHEKMKGQKDLYNEKVSAIRAEMSRLNTDTAERKEKLRLLEKAITAQKQNLEKCAIDKQTLATKQQQLNNELTKLMAAISQDESATLQARSTVLKAAETLADISKNLGSLDKEKSFITDQQRKIIERVNELTVVISQLEAEKAKILAEIEENQATQKSLQEQIAKIEALIQEQNNQTSELSNKIYKLNIQLSTLEANRKMYADIKDTFDGYPTSVKRLMFSSKENAQISAKIKGVVANIIKTDEKYEIAVQTALGNNVQNIVTATPEDARYLIEYLKRTEGGRITFLPVSNVRPHADGVDITSALNDKGAIGLATKLVRYEPYYENVIRYLLGNTLIADNIENATEIAKKHKFAFKIVTLDGDVINSSGSMTGGSRKLNQPNLLSPERMVEKLGEDINKVKLLTEKAQQTKDKLIQSVNSLVEKLDARKASLQSSKQRLSALEVQRDNYLSLIKSNEAELEVNKESITVVTQRLQEIQIQYTDVEEGNKKLVEEKQSASSVAERHQGEYDSRKKRRDEIIAEISDLRMRETVLDADVNTANAEIARMTSEITDNEQIIAINLKHVEDDKLAIYNLDQEVIAMTSAIEQESGITALNAQIKENEQLKHKYNADINQLDLRRQILTAEIKRLDDKRHQEEIDAAKVDSDLEYMQMRVYDEYGETYETCAPLRDENYDITNSKEEIAKLKRRISALGNINPDAIDEYRQQSEEYAELKTQQDDLEKAEEDLKEVLKTIRNEMINEFNSGFEQIRGHFKRTFKELFGGGAADLYLDYENADDPLNAGVVIMAEPPGKKLQNISLLSGGEKSLTAIAILFAILKLRPMPFCVLDEIEAALDDANVERFARYLQQFSKETQFVVITHKRVTMELADCLFGVTMEEKGVSKIVSVNLSDVDSTMAD